MLESVEPPQNGADKGKFMSLGKVLDVVVLGAELHHHLVGELILGRPVVASKTANKCFISFFLFDFLSYCFTHFLFYNKICYRFIVNCVSGKREISQIRPDACVSRKKKML